MDVTEHLAVYQSAPYESERYWLCVPDTPDKQMACTGYEPGPDLYCIHDRDTVCTMVRK